MTEIYVIRHVQAEGNLYRHMQGHWDGDVTAVGVRQRDALAERFKDIPVDAIYSSDLWRARFTASAITKYHDLPIRTDRRLREINIGPWEAEPFANIVWSQPELFNAFMHDQEHFYLAGAEIEIIVLDRAEVQPEAELPIHLILHFFPGAGKLVIGDRFYVAQLRKSQLLYDLRRHLPGFFG